jgi:hypothetical protein
MSVPRFLVVLSAAVVVSLGASQQAIASPILIGSGAFVSPTVIDFSGIPTGQQIAGQFSGSGVTFSGALYGMTNFGDISQFPSNGGGVIASNWIYGPGLQGLSFTATLGSQQQRVGFYLENFPNQTVTVELFNGLTSLGTVQYHTASLTAEFVGVQDLTGFNRVVVTNTRNTNGFFAIDDFQFESAVPEPGTLLLLSTGLVALVSRRRFRLRG